ncbi:hypothetical protein SMICM17S_11960 [Streptomyces microflavus]
MLKGDGALFDNTSATSAEAESVELPVPRVQRLSSTP